MPKCSILNTTVAALSSSRVYPENPYNASWYHFESLKNNLIYQNPVVLQRKYYWNCLIITIYFFHLSPTSGHLRPLQAANSDSKSRLVVDGDGNGKFRLERVNTRFNKWSVPFRLFRVVFILRVVIRPWWKTHFRALTPEALSDSI